VKAQRLPHTTIVRPGLLERGELARGAEKVFARLLSGVAVGQVARVMVTEAEKWHSGHSSGSTAAEPEVRVYEMKELQQYA
jgi:hypothetical protein